MLCFRVIKDGVYSYITGVFTCILYKKSNLKGYRTLKLI